MSDNDSRSICDVIMKIDAVAATRARLMAEQFERYGLIDPCDTIYVQQKLKIMAKRLKTELQTYK